MKKTSCRSAAYTVNAFSRSVLMPTFSRVNFCIEVNFWGTLTRVWPSQRHWISSKNSVEFQHLQWGRFVVAGSAQLKLPRSRVWLIPWTGAKSDTATGDTMSTAVTILFESLPGELALAKLDRFFATQNSTPPPAIKRTNAPQNTFPCARFLRLLHDLIIF